jgi:putative transposase
MDMPRAQRLDLPGVAQHVIQRGNDRQACFYREIDYVRYLQDLREAALKYGCQVHAYVLMTNHVHLLVTPSSAGAVGRMMQAVGRGYVRYLNASICRTGTLWEGRYKASLVDSERYVMACYRYIELNPVRAGMVDSPGAYHWSSHAANARGMHDPLVTPHEVYRQLATNVEQRRAVYRELVALALSDEEMAAIRLYVQRQRALGSSRFQARIELRLQQRAGIGRPGRPRKGLVL